MVIAITIGEMKKCNPPITLNRMKKSLNDIIILFFALVSGIMSLTSCNEDTVLHTYYSISNSGWKKSDTLLFRVDSISQNATYHIALELRSNHHYPYQDIWIVVEREFEPLCQVQIDTIKYRLNGLEPQRRRTGIHHAQHRIHLQSQKMSCGQNGTIRVSHLMKEDVLPGICDVGIHINH